MLKVSVKNLGKIASADIELAPLVILVGKNNTGKSYLANTLWALGDLEELGRAPYKSRRPKWVSDFLAPVGKLGSRRITVDAQLARTMKSALARELQRNASHFLNSIFLVDQFNETSIALEGDEFEPFEVILEVSPRTPTDEPTDPELRLFAQFKGGDAHSILWFPESFLERSDVFMKDYLFYQICGLSVFGRSWTAYNRQTYIPAARTGIMLSLPALVSRALTPDKGVERMTLPRPLLSFVRRMTQVSSARLADRFDSPIVRQLKERLLKGTISKPNESAADFRYTPNGTEISLPLHATSSMITEVAPLIFALNTYPAVHHLVFEEPEAHLHLDAQREMARIIARLVRSGTKVTLTTHSDTFLQQLNNLMVLHGHTDRDKLLEEFGYDRDDLINPDEVRAYEFCPQENRTVVRPLVRGQEGFIVPTLNETLLALAQQTLELR